MDFFEQQDHAHRESKKLLVLFLLAVIAIIAAVNGTLAVIWTWANASHRFGYGYPRFFFWINTGVTLLFIIGGTLVEMFRLRDGGDAVANLAGGRLVHPSSNDPQERRLLSIVEEMAIASGIACPRVYVMDREEAINAFAAGYHQNEAVVAVTRGTLLRLTRDELQGVIGHEFSHILNGDMRMNVKLIGVLFGIQMIAGFGQQLLDIGWRFGSSRSRDEKGPALGLVVVAVGAALFVIGYIGIFFGRLIKSAVSRQREYLADASAVQFTRNPDGIGGALRKIGGLTRSNDCGSRIDSPHAEQLSHMFLGAARPNLLSGFFATHPPLEERLRRIFGKSVDMLDAREIAESVQPELPEGTYGFGARNLLAAQATRAEMGLSDVRTSAASAASTLDLPPLEYAFGEHAGSAMAAASKLTKPATPASIHPELLRAARDPEGARALLFALLLDRSDAQGYAAQLAILTQSAITLTAAAMALYDLIEGPAPHAPVALLTLLDLSMPALKSLTAEQKADALAIVHRLIAADNRMTQAEFVLQTVLQRRLGPLAGRAVPVRYTSLVELKNEAALLLALMARTTANDGTGDNVPKMQNAVARGLASYPMLGLQAADVIARNARDFFEVKQALDKLNQLAPLAKPFLIRLLLAAAGEPKNPDAQALLRGICAALDAPMPDFFGV